MLPARFHSPIEDEGGKNEKLKRKAEPGIRRIVEGG
jgi:hypothetical protein